MDAHSQAFHEYIHALEANLATGVSQEGTHYPTLKSLLEAINSQTQANVLPSQIEGLAPDLRVTKGAATVGYVEAKDIGRSLDEVERSEQMQRYLKKLPNLVLTNYLDFRWYVDGARRLSASAGFVVAGKVKCQKQDIEAVSYLLAAFLAHAAQGVDTPKELAQRMASLAHMIRDTVIAAFDKKVASVALGGLRKAFSETLIPDISVSQFADMYAQTIAYGLFAARCNHSGTEPFTRKSARDLIPSTNPLLQEIFYHDVASPNMDVNVSWLVDDLAQLLLDAEMVAILENFGKSAAKRDPVVDFYETFLSAYDPKLRKKRGVYYTPLPVVSYIARSIDHLLKTRFDRPQGFADQNTLILDPACGTATFLFEVVNLVHETMLLQQQGGMWNGYVAEKLLPRLFGFELLMAPYAVAHLKLGLQLQETGYQFQSGQRLGIYLTNTLEEAIQKSETMFGQYIVDEANAAAEIKKKKKIMVVLGNPPYSKLSANKGKWIEGLVKGRLPDGQVVPSYYEVDGLPLGERNPKWLLNDYVKFLRFGQWRIENTGQGIVGFITDHGYLSNSTFRGMRCQLMNSFNEIYILNLHGNKNKGKGEVSPSGTQDQNVFDIRLGVAIGIFVKEEGKVGPAKIFYADMWGLRGGWPNPQPGSKYRTLSDTDVASTSWTELSPQSPSYLFVPQKTDLQSEYGQFCLVTDIFNVFSSTVTTGRNDFAMAYTPEVLGDRITDLQNPKLDDETVRRKYELQDVSYWNLKEARKKLQVVADIGHFVSRYCYRPFDFRFVFYHGAICERLRAEVMQHMKGGNIAFLTHRPYAPGDFTFAYCTRMIGDQCVAANKSAGGGNSFQFPLYVYPSGNEPQLGQQNQLLNLSDWPLSGVGSVPNLKPEFVNQMKSKLHLEFVCDGHGDLTTSFGPEDIFHYLYAVFYCPTYRNRYAELLKTYFPRLPLTSDKKLFQQLVAKGAELVSMHLLEAPSLEAMRVDIKYSISGSNEVGQVTYDEKACRVRINKTQYFEGVAPDVWNFHVGGYQVCHKWLKDRKGRVLSTDDLQHYQKVVVALKETIRLMAEIDALIPGWPIQ